MASISILAVMLLAALVSFVLAEAIELYDAGTALDELREIDEVVAKLVQRKQSLQRLLDIEQDGLQYFHSAFVPLATLSTKQDLALMDVVRVARKDKKGHVYFPITIEKNGKLLEIMEATGGDVLASVSLEVQAACDDVDGTCSAADRALKQGGDTVDMRAACGGARPFVATMDSLGQVRVHGLAIKRSNQLEKASFWPQEPKDLVSLDASKTAVIMQKDVYIHPTNASVVAMLVYSTLQKSQLVMGTSDGQIQIVDPVSSGKSLVSVKMSPGFGITHLAISQTILAVASTDGTIRFMTLGTNKPIVTSRCELPPGLGAINAIAWLETKSQAERGRFLFVLTSGRDLLLFDRRAPEIQSATAGRSSGRSILSTIIASPSGKSCSAMRRLPLASLKEIIPLPNAQLLVVTKRGPEVFNASSFFTTHGKTEFSSETVVRRTDFTSASNDFAILLLDPRGKTANAYSFLPQASPGNEQEGSTLFVNSESFFSNPRGPMVFILAVGGFMFTINRRFIRSQRDIPDVARRLSATRGLGAATRRGRGVNFGGTSSISREDLGQDDGINWASPSGLSTNPLDD